MTRYSKDQWTEAALGAMAERGTVAINMEQLARELGASKGAIYYHFENRQALLEAALQRWEEMVNADVEAASTIVDASERLAAITLAATGSRVDGFVDVALASSIDDGSVAAAVARVNRTRLDFLTKTLAELGVPDTVRTERALAGLAAYLGLYQLQRSTGQRFEPDLMRSLLSNVIATMAHG